MATFLEQARAGAIGAEEIDDFIDRWHDGDSDASLSDFLGFTTQEYGRWLRDPSALQDIIASSQPQRALERAAG